jgi:D-alanyl-D-alanine carboxypeptidase
MNFKHEENTIAKMALALCLLIGSFSVFSITFGLRKNDVIDFYTQKKDQLIHQETKRAPLFALNDFFSFKRNSGSSEENAKQNYILQQLSQLGKIQAQSFLVGDLDTGEIIFERKSNTVYPIASISKYMTAYTAAETLDPNDIATLTSQKLNVGGGNRARFKVNDKIPIREMLYPLLLVSANDGAEVIAQQKDREVFISDMNRIANEIGMKDSSFEDPSGLSRNNISTARDLFTMMQATRDTYPQIIDISRLSFKEYKNYIWVNINKAAISSDFRGGKTGYTNAALQTSIGYYQIKLANDQTKNIAIVILRSGTRPEDTRNILNYLKRYVAYL